MAAQGIFTLSDLLWYHPYPDESLGLETWKLVVSGQGAPVDANLANYGYFTGGKIVNGDDVSFTERLSYSTETITYLPAAATNITRSGSTKANFRSYAYIFGGDYTWMSNGTAGKYLTTIEKLDFTTETVSVQSGHLYQGFSHGAGVCDGIEDQYTSFYVAGGERLDASGNNQVDNIVYRWESTTNTMVKYAAYSAVDSNASGQDIASRTWSEYWKQDSRYRAEARYHPNGGLGGLNTWPSTLNYFQCPPNADYATYGYGHNASVPFANSSWFIYWPNKPWFNQELIETRTFLSGGCAGRLGFFAGGLTTRDYFLPIYGVTTLTDQTSYQIDFLDFATGTVFRLPYTYQQWLDIHGACMPDHNGPISSISAKWLLCHEQYFAVRPRTNSWPSEGEHWISSTAFDAYYSSTATSDFCWDDNVMPSDMFSGWIDTPVRTYHLDKEEVTYLGQYTGSDGTLEYPTAVPGYHYAAIYGGSSVSKIKNKTLTITSDRTATYINRVRKTAVGAAVASFIAGGSSNGKLVEKANLSTDTVSTNTTQLLAERELMVGSGYLNRDLYQTDNYVDINLTDAGWLGYDFGTFLYNTPIKQTDALFGGLVETIANTPAPAPGYALIAGGHIATLSMGFWYSGPDHGEYLYSVNSCTTDSQKWNFSTGGFSLSTTSALTQGRCNLGGSSNSTHGYYYGGTTIDVLYPYADVDGFTPPDGMSIQNTIGNTHSVTTVEKVSYTIESSSLAPAASGSSLNRSNIVGLGNQIAAWWMGGGVTTTTDYYSQDSGGTIFGPRPKKNDEKYEPGYPVSGYLTQYLRYTNDVITEVTLYSTDTTYNVYQIANGNALGIGHGARGFGTQTFGIVMGGSAQLSSDGMWHPLRTQADQYLGLVVYYSSFTFVTITTLGALQLNAGRIGHSVASTSTHGYVAGGRVYANCYDTANTGYLNFFSVNTTEKINYSTDTVTTLTTDTTSDVKTRTMGQSINDGTKAIWCGGKTISLSNSKSYQSTTEMLTFATDTYTTYNYSANMATKVQNAASLSPQGNGLPATADNTVSYSPQSAGTWFGQTYGWY